MPKACRYVPVRKTIISVCLPPPLPSSPLSPSPVNLSTEVSNELRIYQEHFESSYIEAARDFYSTHAPAYLAENGVQNYMKYVRAGLICIVRAGLICIVRAGLICIVIESRVNLYRALLITNSAIFSSTVEIPRTPCTCTMYNVHVHTLIYSVLCTYMYIVPLYMYMYMYIYMYTCTLSHSDYTGMVCM